MLQHLLLAFNCWDWVPECEEQLLAPHLQDFFDGDAAGPRTNG
jgi:hypothetical protein